MVILIDNEAKESLNEAYNFIKKDSLQNAENVRDKILASIKDLLKILRNILQINIGLIMINLIVLMKSINTELVTMFLRKKSELFELDIQK